METWSYLDYFLGTYDGYVLKERVSCRRGRTPNTRVPYREGANRDGHCRIIRSAGHETIPYFPGEWFPKQVEEDNNGLFEAYMLALLKPWRSVSDLKHADQTFREAYNDFVANVSVETCTMIKNIQFYHESSERARKRNDEDAHENEAVDTTVWTNVDGDTIEGPLPEEDMEHLDDLISEADIERLLDNPYSPRESLFAEAAIAIGVNAGVLRDDEYKGPYPLPAFSAMERHLAQFKTWDEILKNPEEEPSGPTLDLTSVLLAPNPTFERDDEPASFAFVSEPPLATTLGPTLNAHQTMAHTIVTSHLHAHLSQQNPPQ